MGIFSKIWNFIKTGFSKLIGLFKDKGPTQVIDDVSKAAVGVATVAAVGYAGINVVRSLFMRGKKRRAEKRRARSAVDILHEDREPGSLDEKIARVRQSTRSGFGRYAGLSQDDIDLLEEVSKTRNATFRSLSPAEQMNLLHIEGFDFEAFREKMERERDDRKIRKSNRRVGEASPEDASFREPVDYGWWNWLMRPLDDFLCWLKNDPTPKKCPQIHVVDRKTIPNISANSPEELIASLRSIGPYLEGNGDDAVVNDREMAICAEEVFKHKSLKDYRKAVKTRMLQDENGLSSQIFDLMAEDMKGGKKKKRRDDDDDEDSAYFSHKGKSKKNKEDKIRESEADAEAAKIYNHFLKGAMSGKEITQPYRLDRLFDGI